MQVTWLRTAKGSGQREERTLGKQEAGKGWTRRKCGSTCRMQQAAREGVKRDTVETTSQLKY